MGTITDITNLNLPTNEYIVLGSGILGALNIRPNKDIDLLVTPTLFEHLKKSGWTYSVEMVEGREREKLREGMVEVFKDFWYGDGQFKLKMEAIAPQVIDGIPFLTLEVLREVKLKMGREKDRNDVILIDNYLHNITNK